MSFLSTAGNVGYSGLNQMSDASCASQYKMAVEDIPAICDNEVEPYSPDHIDDDTFLPQVSDTIFNSPKFKIDSEDVYAFQDSDTIANEVIVPQNDKATCDKQQDCNKEKLSNGVVSKTKGVVTNGHLEIKTPAVNKDGKCFDAKLPFAIKMPSRPIKELTRSNSISEILHSVGRQSPKRQSKSQETRTSSTKSSISSVKDNSSLFKQSSSSESFLDVFKREIGEMGKSLVRVKEEPSLPAPTQLDVKPVIPIRKIPSGKPLPPTLRSRRGRGPEVHEALQRIPKAAPSVRPNRAWHSPGDSLYQCGPLTDKKSAAVETYSSSEDESDMPSFGSWVLTNADEMEAGSSDSRGSRLAARRATLRRQVAHAATSLRLEPSYQPQAKLAGTIKKQLRSTKHSSVKLAPQALSHLLAARGLATVFNTKERRRLRSYGWSGGDTPTSVSLCEAEGCVLVAMPCAQHCLSHVTLEQEQRLYATCTAVFADGQLCRRPLVHLHDRAPLCQEHAWKRDNYDKSSRECKQPRRPPRKRPTSSTNRRSKRRRRPAPPRSAISATHMHTPARHSPARHSPSLTELNVCSNSSTYDSSEDTGIGGLSETEFMTNSLDVGVVEEVLAHQPDDILDSAVLNQIPDEAFTEFFNQTDCPTGFAESEELARALEAVLDERALDSLDCVFTQSTTAMPYHTDKMQMSSSMGIEMSSITPS